MIINLIADILNRLVSKTGNTSNFIKKIFYFFNKLFAGNVNEKKVAGKKLIKYVFYFISFPIWGWMLFPMFSYIFVKETFIEKNSPFRKLIRFSRNLIKRKLIEYKNKILEFLRKKIVDSFIFMIRIQSRIISVKNFYLRFYGEIEKKYLKS